MLIPTPRPTFVPIVFPTFSPSNPTPNPTLVPTNRASSLVWQGGGNLRYTVSNNGLEITGDAGQCSGGRGFETALASYGGEVDANVTFTLNSADSNMYPSLSVFPVQNSFSTSPCPGRIAVMLQYYNWNYGYIYVFGERSQQSGWVGYNNLQAGSQYTLRLVHSLQQGQTTGYLYGPASGSGPGPLLASTPPLYEVFSSSVKVGFVDSRQNGWSALTSFGVNGIKFLLYCI